MSTETASRAFDLSIEKKKVKRDWHHLDVVALISGGASWLKLHVESDFQIPKKV